MKGIVGRKLGMTQLFDEESGEVTAVTVIEAGPCPVVQLKTEETDGYEAVQLAFEEVPERKVTKPRLGHLKKTDTKPHRHLVEFRGASELQQGETVTVEAFAPGEHATRSMPKTAAIAARENITTSSKMSCELRSRERRRRQSLQAQAFIAMTPRCRRGRSRQRSRLERSPCHRAARRAGSRDRRNRSGSGQ